MRNSKAGDAETGNARPIGRGMAWRVYEFGQEVERARNSAKSEAPQVWSGAVGSGLRKLGGDGLCGLGSGGSRIDFAVDIIPDEPAGDGENGEEHEDASPAEPEGGMLGLTGATAAYIFSKFDPLEVVVFHLAAFAVGGHEPLGPEIFVKAEGLSVVSNDSLIEDAAG
jgi:hypothetical protein